jgi:hypothetical protein
VNVRVVVVLTEMVRVGHWERVVRETTTSLCTSLVSETTVATTDVCVSVVVVEVEVRETLVRVTVCRKNCVVVVVEVASGGAIVAVPVVSSVVDVCKVVKVVLMKDVTAVVVELKISVDVVAVVVVAMKEVSVRVDSVVVNSKVNGKGWGMTWHRLGNCRKHGEVKDVVATKSRPMQYPGFKESVLTQTFGKFAPKHKFGKAACAITLSKPVSVGSPAVGAVIASDGKKTGTKAHWVETCEPATGGVTT